MVKIDMLSHGMMFLSLQSTIGNHCVCDLYQVIRDSTLPREHGGRLFEVLTWCHTRNGAPDIGSLAQRDLYFRYFPELHCNECGMRRLFERPDAAT